MSREYKLMAYVSMLCFLCFLNFRIYAATDTITTTNAIKDPEQIVSSNGTFKLAFFSPPNSTNRYIGISYNKLPKTQVIWVANRNNPLTDSSGSFQISEDGNLQVVNGQKRVLWSSNVTQVATNMSKAQILESGNLVLLNSSNTIIWQSFDHPSNTIMPHMTMIHYKDTRKNAVIQSWKSPSDPSKGRFIIGYGPSVLPEFFIWDNNRRHFRSGPWNGYVFIGVELNYPDYQSLTIQSDGQGTITQVYSHPITPLSNFELTYQGAIVRQYWDDTKGDWDNVFQGPDSECDIYGTCGEFGNCNSKKSPICKCLKGFEPKK